uniref:Uncharacterized protein n=1 Tax=Arundo donax TaxID=35708 RepID=A0A0A9AS67_ARUDO
MQNFHRSFATPSHMVDKGEQS